MPGANSSILRPITIAALAAFDAGLSVVPPRDDGSKRPDDPHWGGRATRTPRFLIEGMYQDGPFAEATGLGVLTGPVFRGHSMDEREHIGLECLDFDDGPTFAAYVEKVKDDPELVRVFEAIRNGYEEETPSGGVHILYKCSTIEGNQKLAERPKTNDEKKSKDDKTKTLIETRGSGGYIVTAPSNGTTHKSGGAYRLRRGGFVTITTVTPAQRARLLDHARTFNQVPETGERPAKGERTGPAGSGRPGDDYNAVVEWEDVLQPHGWTIHSTDGAVTYWRRPGAQTRNKDAATNRDGTDRLWVFSSSTVFPTGKYLNKFAAYAYLNYGGDFVAAANKLRSEGYSGEATAAAATAAAATADTFTVYTVGEYRQRLIPKWLMKGVLREGTLAALIADYGSFKTFIGLSIGLSTTLGRPCFGFDTTKKPVLYIAGEGGGMMVRRIDAWRKYHKISEDPADFFLLPEAVQMLEKGEIDKLERTIDNIDKRPGLIFIDTLARSFVGGNENTQEDMNRYVAAAGHLQVRYGATVVILHHLNRQGEFRGSSALPGALDTMIEMEKTTEGVVLRCQKQKDDEPFPDIRLQKIRVSLDDGPDLSDDDTPIDPDRPTSLVFVPVGTGPGEDGSTVDLLKPNERKALRTLADTVDDWTSTGQWEALARLAGVPKSSFHHARNALIRGEYVEKREVPPRTVLNRITGEGRGALHPQNAGGNPMNRKESGHAHAAR